MKLPKKLFAVSCGISPGIQPVLFVSASKLRAEHFKEKWLAKAYGKTTNAADRAKIFAHVWPVDTKPTR